MNKFKVFRLPDDAPGLKIEDMAPVQRPSGAVDTDSDTAAKRADRKLAEFLVTNYDDDIFVRAIRWSEKETS